MHIVQKLPPLFDEIDAAFNVRGKRVIFAFGDKIFNPAGITVTPELLAHEQVHGQRQLGAMQAGSARGEDAIRQWWHRYITEPEFRLLEEIPAHVEEFKSLCAQHAHRWHSNRAMRRTFAAAIARRLASPLYGGLISFAEAKKALMAGAV